MSGVYDGYHREWIPDPEWRYGTKYTKCRQPRCPNPPVAEFDRAVFYWGSMKSGKRTYAYCDQHLYGRRIENGQVLSWKLVPMSRSRQNETHPRSRTLRMGRTRGTGTGGDTAMEGVLR